MAICGSKISIARAKGTFTFPGWGTKHSPPFPFKCWRMITLSPSIAIARWCSVVESARGNWPSIISRRPRVKVTGDKCRRIIAAPKNTSGVCRLRLAPNSCRRAEELKRCAECDPLKKWKEQLIAEGVISESDYANLDNEIKERIRREFSAAEKEEDPSAGELFVEVTGKFPQLNDEVLPPGKYRIGDTVNKTLRLGLERDKRRIIFGEDIEDPKGGVFRLTQKLSTEFPNQVFN